MHPPEQAQYSGTPPSVGLASAVAALLAIILTHQAWSDTPNGSANSPATPTVSELEAASRKVNDNQLDPRAHLALAEALKKSGRDREAGDEYLKASTLDPSLYLAYHQLTTIKADRFQIEEAVSRLKERQRKGSNHLMLYVALSELLEKQGDYYQAARVLVDLTYNATVPVKYRSKVNRRIHYLLTKAKDLQNAEASPLTDDGLDVAPPLPETSLHTNLSAARVQESKTTPGIGHAPLLP